MLKLQILFYDKSIYNRSYKNMEIINWNIEYADVNRRRSAYINFLEPIRDRQKSNLESFIIIMNRKMRDEVYAKIKL